MKAVSLDARVTNAFQSDMRQAYIFMMLCISCLSLDASEPENPLEGSLLDPWSILGETHETNAHDTYLRNLHAHQSSTQVVPSPAVPPPFGPSFRYFQSKYEAHLDLSALGKNEADSLATRYADGAHAWDEFKPSHSMFPSGAIFYGDPSILTEQPDRLQHTPVSNWWSVLTCSAATFTSLLLLGIYFCSRFRGRFPVER